jgi:membrane protease YdiL (CAAX protease family)
MTGPANRDRLSAVLAAAGVGLAGFLAGLVCVTVAVSLLGAVVPLVEASPMRAAVLLVAQYVGILAVAGLYLDGVDRPRSFLRVERPTARDLAWAVAGVIALFAMLAAATFVLDQVGVSLSDHSVTESADRNPAVLLPLIPLSVLLTGPTEELLYRGIVQTRLERAFGTAPAILGAAAIFALVHVPAYGTGSGGGSLPTTLGLLLVLGALLGALYEHTGNLVVPAVAHGLYNAVTFGVEYLELTGAW